MKRCVIMFALLILTLALAVVSDQKDKGVENELATTKTDGKEMAFGQLKKITADRRH